MSDVSTKKDGLEGDKFDGESVLPPIHTAQETVQDEGMPMSPSKVQVPLDTIDTRRGLLER